MMTSTKALRVAAAVLVLAAVCAAGTAEGLAALEKGDYRNAREEFTAAAEAGEAEAQFQLGEMFRRGLGVSASPRLAAKWYEQAESQGHGGAAGELGILAWKSRKREDAILLLRKGAVAGHVRALYVLALFSYRGEDVGVSEKERWEFFRLAAEGGHPDAQDIYASALKRGKIDGKEQPDEAEKWYRKATAQGHPHAPAGLAECLMKKVDLPNGGTNVTAFAEALECYRLAALRGDYQAQHFLALGQLARGAYADAYAWTAIASSPKNSWPARSRLIKELYGKLADSLKDTLKNVHRYTKPEQVSEGKRLMKEYLKEIRANLKKGLPWEDPDE